MGQEAREREARHTGLAHAAASAVGFISLICPVTPLITGRGFHDDELHSLGPRPSPVGSWLLKNFLIRPRALGCSTCKASRHSRTILDVAVLDVFDAALQDPAHDHRAAAHTPDPGPDITKAVAAPGCSQSGTAGPAG